MCSINKCELSYSLLLGSSVPLTYAIANLQNSKEFLGSLFLIFSCQLLNQFRQTLLDHNLWYLILSIPPKIPQSQGTHAVSVTNLSQTSRIVIATKLRPAKQPLVIKNIINHSNATFRIVLTAILDRTISGFIKERRSMRSKNVFRFAQKIGPNTCCKGHTIRMDKAKLGESAFVLEAHVNYKNFLLANIRNSPCASFAVA